MLFVLSIVLICIAHCMRVYRWELFINTYEKPNRKNLFRALSIGYLFNAFLPMKLGDLVRMWISGNKMKNGKGFSFAIIIVERCLDIIVVGVIFLFFYIFKINVASKSLWFYIALASGLLLFIGLVFVFSGVVKRLLKLIASLFNENIEFRILKFSWALIWCFKDILKRIRKIKLVFSTVLMWGAYIFSYFLFAEFLSLGGVHIGWHNIFYILFAENSIYWGNAGIYSLFNNNLGSFLYFLLYIVLPSAIILLLTFLFRYYRNINNNSTETSYLNLIPHLDKEERLAFLEMYFSNDSREYVENYLKINQHIEIIRDYSAGSNATTMLCKDRDKVFFRKYAFGADGNKLYEQIKWINDYSNTLTLTLLLKYVKEGNYCYYDMPYYNGIETMFDYAHSHQLDSAWVIIQNVLYELEETIYKINSCKSDPDTIRKYISSKVVKNIDKIINAKGIISKLIPYDFIVINGVKYKNLKYYSKFLDEQHLYEIFANDNYSVIHGDLTIENIIVKNSVDANKKNYYIIDPNTGNLHCSPFLDYAKLLQSLHGCYEFLMEQDTVEITENKISFSFKKSQVYYELFKKYDEFLCSKFSFSEVKSIYYHEIIHWIRLMPYKINKIGDRAALFYAGMLMVMNDVVERFETNEK